MMAAGALDDGPYETHAGGIATSVTIPFAPETQAGFLQLAMCGIGYTTAWGTVSGWTSYQSQVVSGATWGPSIRAFTKVYADIDGASKNFHYGSAGSQYIAGKLLAFPVGSAAKVNHGQTNYRTGAGTLVLPTLTEVPAGKLVAFICASSSNMPGDYVVTPPAGMVEVGDPAIVSSQIRIHAFIGDMPAGDTGTRTFTVTGTFGAVCATAGFLIAISGA